MHAITQNCRHIDWDGTVSCIEGKDKSYLSVWYMLRCVSEGLQRSMPAEPVLQSCTQTAVRSGLAR